MTTANPFPIVIDYCKMDWVQKRAYRRDLVKVGSSVLWAHLCSALDRAVRSYNRHFKDEKFGADLKQEDTLRVIIARRPFQASHGKEARFVKVFLDDGGVVAEHSDGHTVRLDFGINSSEKVHFGHEGESLTTDEASELILRRLLFPPSADV